MSGIDRRLNGFSEPQSQTFVWVRLADLQRKSALWYTDLVGQRGVVKILAVVRHKKQPTTLLLCWGGIRPRSWAMPKSGIPDFSLGGSRSSVSGVCAAVAVRS